MEGIVDLNAQFKGLNKKLESKVRLFLLERIKDYNSDKCDQNAISVSNSLAVQLRVLGGVREKVLFNDGNWRIYDLQEPLLSVYEYEELYDALDYIGQNNPEY